MVYSIQSQDNVIAHALGAVGSVPDFASHVEGEKALGEKNEITGIIMRSAKPTTLQKARATGMISRLLSANPDLLMKQNPMVQKLFLLIGVLALCFATTSNAQISVGATGSAVQTFDAVPPLTEWGTTNLAGNGGSYEDAAALDGAMAAFDGTTVLVLGTDNAASPATAQAARWASTAGGYLVTRPTTIAAIVLQGQFRNDTGESKNSVGFQYTLTQRGTFNAEDLVSHRVYWSYTATAGSWTPAPALSAAPGGSVVGEIDLSASPWAPGTTLYVAWVDDNEGTGTDHSWGIDNLQAVFTVVIDPPVVSQNPTNQTRLTCRSASFTGNFTGTSPMTFRWLKDGVEMDTTANPSAATRTLNIASVTAADAGSYALRAVNSAGQATTTAATLTVNVDSAPPNILYVLAQSDPTKFRVIFDEPIDTNRVYDAFNWALYPDGNPGGDIDVIDNFVHINNTTIELTTFSPRSDGVAYTLEIFADQVYDACAGLSAQDTGLVYVPETTPLVNIFSTWKYNDSGTDQDAAFYNTGVEPAWVEAPGVFDAKDVVRQTVSGQTVGTQLQRRTATPPYDTANIPTYYFRTHITYPTSASTQIIQVRPFIDDSYVLYFNGVEAHRLRLPAGNEPFATYGGGGTVGDGNYEGPFVVPATALHSGDNLVSVLLKQADATSSDVTFGLEITPYVRSVVSIPCNITNQPDSQTIVEGQTISLTVGSEGNNLVYQWQKDGSDIPGATSATYTKANALPADSGSYRVAVQNGAGLCVSDAAVVTVNPKPRANVVSVIGLLDATKIDVTFDQDMQEASAETISNYNLPGLTISAIDYTNRVARLTTSARAAATPYDITINGVLDTASTPQTVTPYSARIFQEVALNAMNATWKYEQSNNLDGISWQATGYDDSAWPSGQALLGLEPSTNNPVRNQILTPLTVSTNQPTYYFRTTGSLDYSTAGAGLRVHHYTDDGAVFYINGTRVGNYQMTNNPVYYTNYANAGTTETVSNAFTTTLSASGLVPGNNTIAVEVHQQNATSSDIVWGGQFVVLLQNFNSPGPKLSIVLNANGTVTLSWTPGGGTLRESTNLVNWTNSANQSNPQTFTPTGMKYYKVD